MNAQKKGNIKTVRQGLTSESPSYVFLYNHLPEFLRRVTRVFSFWLSFLSFTVLAIFSLVVVINKIHLAIWKMPIRIKATWRMSLLYIKQAIDISIQTVIYWLEHLNGNYYPTPWPIPRVSVLKLGWESTKRGDSSPRELKVRVVLPA